MRVSVALPPFAPPTPTHTLTRPARRPPAPQVPPSMQRGPGSVARVDVEVCRGMVEVTWRPLLAAAAQLLARASGEALTLALLKARREGGMGEGWGR